jgi:hypothetical protein
MRAAFPVTHIILDLTIFLVTVTWYRTNRSFCDLLCFPSYVLITPDSLFTAVFLQQRRLVAKQEVGKKCP